jgi:hypothetical protein
MVASCCSCGFDQTPNELGVLEDEPEFDPELGPMFGQLAELPPW